MVFRTTLKDKDVLIVPVDDPDYGWLFELYDNEKFKQDKKEGRTTIPACVYRYDKKKKRFYRFSPQEQSYVDFAKGKTNSRGEVIAPRVWFVHIYKTPRYQDFLFSPISDFKDKDIVIFPENIPGFGWLFNIYEQNQFSESIGTRSKYLYKLKDQNYLELDEQDRQRLNTVLLKQLDPYKLILAFVNSEGALAKDRSKIFALLNDLVVSGKINRFEYLLGLMSMDDSIKGFQEKQMLINKIYYESVIDLDLEDLFKVLYRRIGKSVEFNELIKRQIRDNFLKFLFRSGNFSSFIISAQAAPVKKLLKSSLECLTNNKIITPLEKKICMFLLNGKDLEQISKIMGKHKSIILSLLIGSYTPEQLGLLDILGAYYKKIQRRDFNLESGKIKSVPKKILETMIYELTDTGVITADEADLLEYYVEGRSFSEIADEMNEFLMQKGMGIIDDLIKMEEDRVILSSSELKKLKDLLARTKAGQIKQLKHLTDSVNEIVGKKIELELPKPVTKGYVERKLFGIKRQLRKGALGKLDEYLSEVISNEVIDVLAERFHSELIDYALEQIVFFNRDILDKEIRQKIIAALEQISKQKGAQGVSARALLFWADGVDGRYSGLLKENGYENENDKIVDIDLIRSAFLAEHGLVNKMFDYLSRIEQSDKAGSLLLDKSQAEKMFMSLKSPEDCFECINDLILFMRKKYQSLINRQRQHLELDILTVQMIEKAI